MATDHPCTLNGLLNQYTVEIPFIQRDYAYGRIDDSTSKKRKRLLDDMATAVAGRSLPKNLGFVYGRVEGKGPKAVFVPIDGQQRLTTLFLLHLYAFLGATNEDADLLAKFKYKVRDTSENFLDTLIKNRIDLADQIENHSQGALSALIKDQSWFMPSWMLDPTVQSMLVVLDEIDSRFKSECNLAERLLSNGADPCITFDFLNMSDANADLISDDALYLRLNDRGKQLSAYENMKAAMLEALDKIPESELNFPGLVIGEEVLTPQEAFERKLDGEWFDFVWASVGESRFDLRVKTDRVDSFFQILIASIIVLNRIANEKAPGLKEEDSNLWVYQIDSDDFTSPFFNALYWMLEAHTKQQDPNSSDDFFHATLNAVAQENNEAKIITAHTLLEWVRFFTEIQYFSYRSFQNDDNDLAERFKNSQWHRIIYNLAYNANLKNDRMSSEFDKWVNGTRKNLYFHGVDLTENKDVLEACWERLKEGNAQEREEAIKASIILNDESTKDAITKAESYDQFKGAIRYALYPALKRCGEGWSFDHNTFDKYRKTVTSLFDAINGNRAFGNDARKALLLLGDENDNYAYCPRLNRKNEWVDDKAIYLGVFATSPETANRLQDTFLDVEFNEDGRLAGFGYTLTSLLIGTRNEKVNEALAKVNENLEKKRAITDQRDWRYCFVQHKDLFDLAGKDDSHKKQGVLKHAEGTWDIILQNQHNGPNSDLYLCALQSALRKDRISLAVDTNSTSAAWHYAYVASANDDPKLNPQGNYILVRVEMTSDDKPQYKIYAIKRALKDDLTESLYNGATEKLKETINALEGFASCSGDDLIDQAVNTIKGLMKRKA